MRSVITDLGVVHGHYFDPVPSYFYALQIWQFILNKQIFMAKITHFMKKIGCTAIKRLLICSLRNY